MDALERYLTYSITKQGVQLNDIYRDQNNPIHDILVKKPSIRETGAAVVILRLHP
jgi:hypothetical protein